MTKNIEYQGRALIHGKIELLSGLHIGAGKDTIEIGGLDNPVVKHPHTGHPYIPGSSLKGKLRFLLEWAFGKIRKDGQAWGFNEKDPLQKFEVGDHILRIFGTPAKKDLWSAGPTRLVVRDAFLNKAWLDDALAKGFPLTEEKTEVVIDRIAGKAHEGVGPRQMERVPAGALFDMEMVFRLYAVDGDGGARDKACLNWLLAGLSLLEQDALGGSGSRGYGRIRFRDLEIVWQGERQNIDNRFRVERFDPETAPAIVEL